VAIGRFTRHTRHISASSSSWSACANLDEWDLVARHGAVGQSAF